MTTHSVRMLVFIGSYAEASDSGVYVYSFDGASGELALLDQVSGLKNPTFLNLDAARLKLYSIEETETEAGRSGGAVSFSIDPQQGTISKLNQAVTVDSPTCHIQRDADDRYLIVSSYHGGQVGLVSLNEDGTIGKLLDVKQHEGNSVHPERQEQPHPHSAFFSPDYKYVYISDLGLDRIVAYSIDAAHGTLKQCGETVIHPGAGPRHLAFHPDGKYAFVINELDSTITSLRYEADSGRLLPFETVTTLPVDYNGDNSCAEITVSRDGNFLYGSNRGHDSIVVYSIDKSSGKLTLVEHVSTEGKHPRHFALTPDGDFLIAANRDTDNLTVFRVNQDTGKLTYTGNSFSVSKPVCVQMAYFSV
ncbi:lactonase family protein [Paenibacillus sp. J2TS4]|uniref:lactonase family protein n=1 Tax=Paenibacillus sp. J2TS4 TaxID=2807194 RepID=UPI001B260D8B|nr:lactonase family protein [Paenibacillus sp. J2TS4]GIP35201.1 hypothetical protein J2TS4_44110 [Paenibacillus sp. J2TS4]